MNTVKRMEKGDPRVQLHFVARALYVFGDIERVAQLFDTSEDQIGLVLMDAQVPKRIRSRKAASGAL